jgi:hypothetical protein
MLKKEARRMETSEMFLLEQKDHECNGNFRVYLRGIDITVKINAWHIAKDLIKSKY